MRPNIIFIIDDQHRWDFMGYERSNGVTLTPNLDALARGGAVFRSAYCTSPLCSPSRAAIALGRYGMNSGSYTNLHEPPPGSPTFVSQLRKAGYRTCAVGKTHMEIHAYDSDLCSESHRTYMDSLGWDQVIEYAGNDMFRTGIRDAFERQLREKGVLAEILRFYRQWLYFMDGGAKGDDPFTVHEWPLVESLHGTTFAADCALEWLDGLEKAAPSFLHIGFSAPHSPIDPPPRYMALYGEVPETPPWGCGDDASRQERMSLARKGYRALISQIDAEVGRVVKHGRERGELDRTIFVFTSDHGEMAGDHGLTGKTCFFDASVRVPLIFSGLGIKKGVDTTALVELVDIGSTLCDLAGVKPHHLDQGRSLVPLLTGLVSRHRENVYCEMGCDRMLFDGRYKLMRGDPLADQRRLGRLHLDKPANIPASPARLYDLLEDPHETHDVFEELSHREIRMNMLEKLLDRINENIQPLANKSRGMYRPVEC